MATAKARLMFLLLLILIGLPPALTSSANQTVALAAPQTRPLKLPLVSPRIIVRKADRKLLLYSAGKLVRTYHVALGLSPVGDKVR